MASQLFTQFLTYISYYLLFTHHKRTLSWKGLEWSVRRSYDARVYPGPTYWSGANVWVDNNDYLHMEVTNQQDRWYSTQICTKEVFKFGSFTVDAEGKFDEFDPVIVFGFYAIANSTVGSKSNEIDIEISNWSNRDINHPDLYYAVRGGDVQEFERKYEPKKLVLKSNLTTHTFDWKTDMVDFSSYEGTNYDKGDVIHTWKFAPSEYLSRIPQVEHHLCINFWNHKGNVPYDRKPLEIVISDLKGDHIPQSSKKTGKGTEKYNTKAMLPLTLTKHVTQIVQKYIPLNVDFNILGDQTTDFITYLQSNKKIDLGVIDWNELAAIDDETHRVVEGYLQSITQNQKNFPKPDSVVVPLNGNPVLISNAMNACKISSCTYAFVGFIALVIMSLI